MYAQQRLRSALASAESDQSLLCTQWVTKDRRISTKLKHIVLDPLQDVLGPKHCYIEVLCTRLYI